jgi:hypothetical protein
MNELEERFDLWCQWWIGNARRGAQVVDSAKRYEFLTKTNTGLLELIGLIINELQRLEHRDVQHYGEIVMPSGATIRGRREFDYG